MKIKTAIETSPWPTQQLYGHLPPITKTIKVRRTRHSVDCWRSKDEVISDVLLWTPLLGRAKAGRLARTYIQLCVDTECSQEDLPGAMDDRDGWQERVWDISADDVTLWWWWWWWYISSIASGSLSNYILSSCCRYVLAGRSTLTRPCEGVQRSTLLMSLSFFSSSV